MISNRKRLWAMVCGMLSIFSSLQAQDFSVMKFERNYTSLIASMSPMYDNTGNACAVIRCFVRDTTIVVEPNLGLVKRVTLPSEIRLWVPQGTKRLTIRGNGLLPLRGYNIPVRVESKATYEMEIEVSERNRYTREEKRKEAEVTMQEARTEEKAKRKQEKLEQKKEKKSGTTHSKLNLHPMVGAGYDVLGLSGPSLSLGVMVGHELIEISGVYGVQKSERLYFYRADDDDLIATWQYHALRASLRYGHEFNLGIPISCIPMVGISGQTIRGTNGLEGDTQWFKKASSLSASVGLRLAWKLGKILRIQATPGWNIGIYKSKNCQLINKENKMVKSWTDGLNVNVGIAVEL